MLSGIKSSFIIKKIYNLLNSKTKLKIVLYNTKLTKILNLTPIDYMKLSAIFIVEDKNGKRREYDSYSDELIYEGECLNNKRNGIGKEYSNGNLIFEGEYSNGKRKKGKLYDKYGFLIFEGEFSQGKEWWNGYGKEYDKFHNLLFEGEYINGKRGKGIISENKINNKIYLKDSEDNIVDLKNQKENKLKYFKEYDEINNLIFEGEYLNGKRNGKGKEYNKNNYIIFEGEYLNGQRNGKGKEYYENSEIIKYEGEYLNGKRNGKGNEYKSEKLIFEGEYLSEHKKEGKEYYENGKLKYEGEFLFNKYWNGKAYDYSEDKIYEFKNGNCNFFKEYDCEGNLVFEGEYVNGRKNGKGKEYYNSCYEGKYLNNKRNGKGSEYTQYDKLIFEGEYRDGNEWSGIFYDIENQSKTEIKNGQGFIRKFNRYECLEYEGEYLNGKRHGKGKEFNSYDGLIYEGEYLNGKRHGKGKEFVRGYLTYEGEYLNGKRNGKGKEYEEIHIGVKFKEKDLIFEGEFLDGERWNGKGKETGVCEALIFKGEYFCGEFWNGTGYKYDLDFYGPYLESEEIYTNGNKKVIEHSEEIRNW